MRAGEKESYLKQYFWKSGGTITASQALLGASALTHAAVKALDDTRKVIIEIPQGWLALEMRFYSDADANTSDILQLYAAMTSNSNPDHYRHFAQLTNTVGTQVYGDYKFIDTIADTGKWLTRLKAVSPANNTFGSFPVNTHCHSHILVIASTLNSTTLGVEYKKV